MKSIILGIAILIILIVLGGIYVFLTNKKTLTKVVQIKDNLFTVEVADNAIIQARGLSGRPQLEEEGGMLFIFSDEAIRSFWMAGMNFSLDIIWIKGDEIVGISENLPPALGLYAPTYSSPEPVDKVLEINAGLVKKMGISVGDWIRFD